MEYSVKGCVNDVDQGRRAGCRWWVEAALCHVCCYYCVVSYPDVMMPSYNASYFSSLFFISYLAIELYFIMNLVKQVLHLCLLLFIKKTTRFLFTFVDLHTSVCLMVYISCAQLLLLTLIGCNQTTCTIRKTLARKESCCSWISFH